MTLNEKIGLLLGYANEIAFGYSDAGCFWRMTYGPRGAGSMMSGVGGVIAALDSEDFESAVDYFLEQMALQRMAR